MQNRNVEVIAGVNLPMLVKLGRVRGDTGLADAVALAQEAGRKYITVANSILGGAS
jgi:PTS system mannose-specific IIA component